MEDIAALRAVRAAGRAPNLALLIDNTLDDLADPSNDAAWTASGGYSSSQSSSSRSGSAA